MHTTTIIRLRHNWGHMPAGQVLAHEGSDVSRGIHYSTVDDKVMELPATLCEIVHVAPVWSGNYHEIISTGSIECSCPDLADMFRLIQFARNNDLPLKIDGLDAGNGRVRISVTCIDPMSYETLWRITEDGFLPHGAEYLGTDGQLYNEIGEEV